MNNCLLKQNKVLLIDKNGNKTDENLIGYGSTHTSVKHHNFVSLCRENLPKCLETKALQKLNTFSEEGNIG